MASFSGDWKEEDIPEESEEESEGEGASEGESEFDIGAGGEGGGLGGGGKKPKSEQPEKPKYKVVVRHHSWRLGEIEALCRELGISSERQKYAYGRMCAALDMVCPSVDIGAELKKRLSNPSPRESGNSGSSLIGRLVREVPEYQGNGSLPNQRRAMLRVAARVVAAGIVDPGETRGQEMDEMIRTGTLDEPPNIQRGGHNA
jgi:hypothetical protein